MKQEDFTKSKQWSRIFSLRENSYVNTLHSSYGSRFSARNIKASLAMRYLYNFRPSNEALDFANSVGYNVSEGARLTLKHAKYFMTYNDSDKVLLPRPRKISGKVDTYLNGRRSVREFSKLAMSKQDLSDILYNALGVKGDNDFRFNYRSYSSAGGLYPISLIFYSRNVKDLQNGSYGYDPFDHVLYKIQEEEIADISVLSNLRGIDKDNYNIFGFLVYDIRKNMLKYGESALNFACYEAGSIMQTLQIAMFFKQIGICELGGFKKRKIEKKFNIDGHYNHVISAFIAGGEK